MIKESVMMRDMESIQGQKNTTRIVRIRVIKGWLLKNKYKHKGIKRIVQVDSILRKFFGAEKAVLDFWWVYINITTITQILILSEMFEMTIEYFKGYFYHVRN